MVRRLVRMSCSNRVRGGAWSTVSRYGGWTGHRDGQDGTSGQWHPEGRQGTRQRHRPVVDVIKRLREVEIGTRINEDHGMKRFCAGRSDIAECEVRLARRPDTADERFLSAVQHLASVLRARGRSEDVLLALSELLEKDYLSPEREQPRR